MILLLYAQNKTPTASETNLDTVGVCIPYRMNQYRTYLYDINC
jgi:hypothetical protein